MAGIGHTGWEIVSNVYVTILILVASAAYYKIQNKRAAAYFDKGKKEIFVKGRKKVKPTGLATRIGHLKKAISIWERPEYRVALGKAYLECKELQKEKGEQERYLRLAYESFKLALPKETWISAF